MLSNKTVKGLRAFFGKGLMLALATLFVATAGYSQAGAEPLYEPAPSKFSEKTAPVIDTKTKQNVWIVKATKAKFDDVNKQGSLRWAVDQAVKAGGKHWIVISSNGSATDIGKTIEITGAPIEISGDVQITLYSQVGGYVNYQEKLGGNTIKRTEGKGGIFKIVGDAEHAPSLYLFGLTFEGAKPTSDILEYNKNRENDGAIQFSGNNTKLDIVNCTFRNNEAIGGAALYGRGGRLFVRNTLFENNKSIYGGAVDIAGGGKPGKTDLDLYHLKAEFKACSFKNNTAGNGEGSSKYFGRGGAMIISSFQNTEDDEVIIDGCSFTGNKAELHGGAVAVSQFGHKVIFRNTTFSGNSVVQHGSNWAQGGAVFTEAGLYNSKVLLENCTLVGNTAEYDGEHIAASAQGGAIAGGKFEMKGSIAVGNGLRLSDKAKRPEGDKKKLLDDMKEKDSYDLAGVVSLNGYNLIAHTEKPLIKSQGDIVDPDFSDFSKKEKFFGKWLKTNDKFPKNWVEYLAEPFDISEETTGTMAGVYKEKGNIAVATIALAGENEEDLKNNPAYEKIPSSLSDLKGDARDIIRSSMKEIGAYEVYLKEGKIASPEFNIFTDAGSFNAYRYRPVNITELCIKGAKNYPLDKEVVLDGGYSNMVWQVSLAQFYMPIEKTSNSFVTADGYCTPLIEKGSIHFRGDLGYVINGKTFWDKGISSTIPNVNASLTVFNSYAPKTLKFAKDITVHEGEALPAELLMPGYLFEDVTSGGDAVSSDVTTEMIDPRIIWEVTQGKDKVQRAIAADADDPANIGWGWGKGLHKGSAVLKATSIKTMEQNEEDDMNPVLSTAMNITITWAKDAVYIKDAEIETPDVTLGLEGTASQLLKVILEKSDPKKSITTEYSISWSSDNEKVAKVTEKKSNKHFAMVEAVAEGTAKITATITEGSEIQEKTIHTAVCTVTVTKDGGASVTPETTPSGIDTTPVIPTIDMDPDMFSPAAPVTLTDPTELPGFAEKDVTIDNKGNITPKKSVVTKTVNSVVEKAVAAGTVEKGTKVEEQKMLPAFKAAGAPGRIISVGFDIKGSDLFADAPKNVKLVKVNSAAGKSDFFKYAANKDEYADMTYSVVASDNSVPEKLDANETYTLILFIQDGGDFDLDGQIDGSVTDPTAIVKTKVETESSTPDTPSGGDAGSGSSGGCNAGFAGMLLLGLIPAFIFKKKD